ncbi:hypothetical protein LUZ60_004677 [Juncus effusus]|nr:hypothetical protein LUZ60_004677 [Juncus effusus]
MRKKLETRFPASRIKKIMQADEDVGKIALAVPVLVSKALELFLQDLCDRTYQITLERGAKTVNSSHLKQCVKTYSEFDFLSEIVNKVPSLGGSEPSGDEMVISRRRKSLSVDSNLGHAEDLRSPNKVAMTFSNPSPRGGGGRGGRGRGRGRGRPPKRKEINYVPIEEDNNLFSEKDNNFPSDEPVACNPTSSEAVPTIPSTVPAIPAAVPATPAAVPAIPPAVPAIPPAVPTVMNEGTEGSKTGEENQVDELAPWGVDPSGSAEFTMQIDQDEDYDNED